MTHEECAIKLQETIDLAKRNRDRIEKLEEEHQALNSLTTSVAVMVEKMETMNGNVKTLTTKVEELESLPAKRWNGLVEKIIFSAAGILIGFLFSQIGIG